MSDDDHHEELRLIAYCPHCEDKREAHVDGEFVAQDEDGFYIYRLVHCSVCCDPMLVVQEPLPTGEESDPARLYPPTRSQFGDEVPRAIRRLFPEAVACFELAKSWTATALMCRRILEVAAIELGEKGQRNNLALTLKKLYESGVLDKTIYEWSTELRTLGNEAAHGDTVHISREDAEDALHFTEALVSYVFTYRVRFEQYKERQLRRDSDVDVYE